MEEFQGFMQLNRISHGSGLGFLKLGLGQARIFGAPVGLGFLKIQKVSKVDPVVLNHNGLIRSALKPVKILGKGDIDIKISITASSFSKTAKSKIENAGGTVIVE